MPKISLIFLFFFPVILWSQAITGTVYDENNETVPGASVYLDGTSIGTITDEKGRFSFSGNNVINTVLVVSFIGYETIMVQNPFEKPRYEFRLVPKIASLKEVVVQADGFTRKQKLKVFREQFLGMTKAAKNCRILNEADINFYYDLKKNQLTATSDVPLKIENNHLGYEIHFNLVSFYAEFTHRSILSKYVYKSFYGGTTAYSELTDTKGKYAKNRRKSFNGSPMHFFRNLAHGKWGKKEFELYKGSFITNPSEEFSIKKESSLYKITLLSPSNIKMAPLTEAKYVMSYNLMYDRSEQSKVIFETTEFMIDEFGNTNNPYAITFGGEISQRRAGDLLPMDYKN